MPSVGSEPSALSTPGRPEPRRAFSGVSQMFARRKAEKAEKDKKKETEKEDREYLENTPITGYHSIQRFDGFSRLNLKGKWSNNQKNGYEDHRALLEADKIEMRVIKKLIPFDRDINEIITRLENLPPTDTLPKDIKEQLDKASDIRDQISGSSSNSHFYCMNIILDYDYAKRKNKIPLAQRILNTYQNTIDDYRRQNISVLPVFHEENVSFRKMTPAEKTYILEHRPIWIEASGLQKLCQEKGFLDPDNRTLKDADKIRLERLSMCGDIPADERPDDMRSPSKCLADIYESHDDLKLYRDVDVPKEKKKEQAGARKKLHTELFSELKKRKQEAEQERVRQEKEAARERAMQAEIIPMPEETYQMLRGLWNEFEERDLIISKTDTGNARALKENDMIELGKGIKSKTASRKDISDFEALAKRLREEYASDLKFDPKRQYLAEDIIEALEEEL